MAKNEFLPFGIADGANVLSNEEYSNLATRTNGFSSGVAKSQELNKVWRQASVIASVVAQFIAETNKQDVLDDGNTAALRAGLLNALRATVGANIPVASQTLAGITKLSNATNSNSEVDAATPRAVKATYDLANTANQNAGNAITNANTAIQNAANANNNANSRLEKDQNGADIPNKPKFVDNLGLTDTVERAKNAASLTEWTPQIFNSDVYAKTIISGLPGADRTYLEVVNAVAMWQTYVGERSYTLRHPAVTGTVAIIEELYKKSELYTVTESNNRFGYKNDAKLDQNGWWKCGDTGVILQWGYTEKKLAESSETITFSTEFPRQCFGGLATPSYTRAHFSNSSAYFFNLNDGKRAVITCDQSTGAPDDGSYIFWWAVGI
ncbi:putative phage tail fiber protein [Xenorhabdus bovienii str. puntauvense]|uniref:Putative phage tail fiber protein n=1 Tax=Xenorhabdus bovienii str. puntauvense TaxID=1398201 RepID=A0A077NG27_XENBV|nr:phage tail protein [Xenorhabdus bovienii]CDG97724.1 putative phage tail fiber protein [Xenorhabdus bovienii str. puntauvense]